MDLIRAGDSERPGGGGAGKGQEKDTTKMGEWGLNKPKRANQRGCAALLAHADVRTTSCTTLVCVWYDIEITSGLGKGKD